jgi:hypothetical protein
MRSLRIAALAGAVAAMGFAAPVRAQNTFEGVIEFRFLNKDSMTMTQTSKGNMVRIDVHGKESMPMAMMYDSKANTMTMVMYAQKMYMVNPMPSLDSALASHDRKVSFTKTGQTETVAGVSCTIYKGSSTDANGKVSEGQACLAKGVGFMIFQSMNRGRGGPQGSMAEMFRELAAQDLRAIKMWSMKDGKMVPEIEAVSIEKKSIPNSTFEIPSDFRKMDMPAGMGGMPTKP